MLIKPSLALETNANVCVFESQCPKIRGLSKPLKAKLSSIPNGVASLSTPDLYQRGRKKTAAIILGLRSTTRRGDAPALEGLVGGPSREWYCVLCVCVMCGMVRTWLRVLSLSMEEGRFTFGGMAGIWAKFKGLPKLSGVATNHWVFLRCDWSLVSNWFYYQA